MIMDTVVLLVVIFGTTMAAMLYLTMMRRYTVLIAVPEWMVIVIKSKKNKNRPPLSVRGQIREAEDKAIELVLALTFTALLDKFCADFETMQAIWKQVNKYAEEVSTGQINVKDLAKTLRNEYQIDITGGLM